MRLYQVFFTSVQHIFTYCTLTNIGPIFLFQTGTSQPTDQKLDPLLSSEPVFVGNSYTQVYTLQPCSPALNTGNPSSDVETDQTFAQRAVGELSDSGAYESAYLPCISCTQSLEESSEKMGRHNSSWRPQNIWL